MRLVHCTNYWGEHINGTDNDDEVSFDAIWVQARLDHQGCCCPGFGRRRVLIRDDDINGEHSGWWSLFSVSCAEGRSQGHYFWKYVLIPQGTYGYGKRGCAGLGWTYIGEVHSSCATAQLEGLIGDRLDEQYDYDFNHVHIGIRWDGTMYAGKGGQLCMKTGRILQ